MAVTSLEDFVGFMKTYASGNDFTRNGGKGEYHEGQFLQPPMLRIRLESYWTWYDERCQILAQLHTLVYVWDAKLGTMR